MKGAQKAPDEGYYGISRVSRVFCTGGQRAAGRSKRERKAFIRAVPAARAGPNGWPMPQDAAPITWADPAAVSDQDDDLSAQL